MSSHGDVELVIHYANKTRFALSYDLRGKALVLPHEMIMEM